MLLSKDHRKIALLSDIHSNVFALEAVITDAKRQKVDLLLNLGDILYGPIAPLATYQLLMKHDFVTISGNQDRQVYESGSDEIAANPSLQFILDDLGDEPLEWLKSLPFDKQLSKDIYLCHGTPSSDLIYLLEDVKHGHPRLRADNEICELIKGNSSPIICCGHTHIPRMVKTSGGQLIINPGSVGLQAYTDEEPVIHSMENYSSHASYSILEKKGSAWRCSHIRVPYDIESAISACKERKRMDWAHYLETGRKLD